MAYITGMISSSKGNTFVSDYAYNVTFSLPADRTYMFAIDQSSSCVGIYITDTNLSFHGIFDFKNTGEEKFRYYEQLRLFVKRIFKGCDIGLMVREDLPPVKYRNAGNTLRELIGVLGTWSASIEEIAKIPEDKVDKIYPQTWKSKIVDKSKGKGRTKDKRAIAEDICDMIPQLSAYINRCPSKDYDSFDACGILHGYLKTHYGEGRRKIAGSKSYYGNIIAFYRLIDKQNLGSNEKLKGFEVQAINEGVNVLELNKEHPLLANFKMAASRYPFVMTIIDDPMQNLAVRWQFDLGMNDKVLVCYILRRNLIGKKQLEILKGSMPYEEIVG